MNSGVSLAGQTEVRFEKVINNESMLIGPVHGQGSKRIRVTK